MRNSAGFTLLEVLIALAIFAVIAIAGAMTLHALSTTHTHLQNRDDNLREVITAVTLLRRDISQIVQREIADISGSKLPALLIPNRQQFEFTRLGLANPNMSERRSTLQRVAYQYEDHVLYRLTWPVVDRAPKTVMSKRKLLTHIQQFQLNFVNEKGQIVAVWADNSHLPCALILEITLEKMGKLQLILPIRGRGYANY